MLQAIFFSGKLKFLGSSQLLFFQIPTNVPHPDTNTPIDFSKPEDVIIYIVIPLIIVGLYFAIRSQRKKPRT